jgi:hypothetical protein
LSAFGVPNLNICIQQLARMLIAKWVIYFPFSSKKLLIYRSESSTAALSTPKKAPLVAFTSFRN